MKHSPATSASLKTFRLWASLEPFTLWTSALLLAKPQGQHRRTSRARGGRHVALIAVCRVLLSAVAVWRVEPLRGLAALFVHRRKDCGCRLPLAQINSIICEWAFPVSLPVDDTMHQRKSAGSTRTKAALDVATLSCVLRCGGCSTVAHTADTGLTTHSSPTPSR